MIQYLYTEGQKACEKEPLIVSFNGRIAGEIRKVEGGYQYFAKSSKGWLEGDIFPSVGAVQASLRGEE